LLPEYRKLVWVISFFVAMIVIGVIILVLANISLASIGGELATFWVSLCIGMAGAGVYLLILLMTEKNLEVLKNELVPNVFLMSFLYLLSGGFVAAVTQISTGLLASNSMHAVFMVGFGWQGAISGVAGTGTRVKLVERANDKTIDANRAEEKTEIIKASLEKKIQELKKELAKKISGVEE